MNVPIRMIIRLIQFNMNDYPNPFFPHLYLVKCLTGNNFI